jgi:hypothetical protein
LSSSLPSSRLESETRASLSAVVAAVVGCAAAWVAEWVEGRVVAPGLEVQADSEAAAVECTVAECLADLAAVVRVADQAVDLAEVPKGVLVIRAKAWAADHVAAAAWVAVFRRGRWTAWREEDAIRWVRLDLPAALVPALAPAESENLASVLVPGSATPDQAPELARGLVLRIR